MSRCPGTWVLGLCALLALVPAAVVVQAEEPTHTLRADGAAQIVILQNGRTLKGKVSRSPNGYVVEHSAGRLVVPFDEVRVIGDSLPDGFRKLRESFVNPTAATHYQLAQWSWSHHLVAEAREELVMALDRESDHEPSRELLRRIDEHLAAERRRAAGPVVKPLPKRMMGDIELPEIESLAGLSRETAARYTSRIQPLLINKCANAGCHGQKSETPFRLDSIRGTGAGHRVHSERNLAAVLRQIDPQRPLGSPLLTVPTKSHGGLNKSIFYGPAGEQQLQTLKDWIRVAAKELASSQLVAGQRPAVTPGQPVFPPSPAPPSDEEPRSTSSVRTPMASVPLPKLEKPADEAPEDQVDEFDPQVFNRRHHGGRQDASIKQREMEKK